MTIALNTLDAPRMVEHIKNGLSSADEIDISVSFVRYSGVQLIVDQLRKFLERGGKARLLTSTYMGITQPEALKSLSKLKGLHCRVQSSRIGFHPKMYLFFSEKSQCWVGSSNLSKGGLVSNIEANLMSNNPSTIREIRRGFDELWSRADVFDLNDIWLDAYAQAFLNQISRPFINLPPPPGSSDGNGPSDLGLGGHEANDGPFALVPATHQPNSTQPTPNEAQREAQLSLAELREHGAQRAVVIVAPGVGKTFLAAFDALAFAPNRVLFLSHRLEHLT